MTLRLVSLLHRRSSKHIKNIFIDLPVDCYNIKTSIISRKLLKQLFVHFNSRKVFYKGNHVAIFKNNFLSYKSIICLLWRQRFPIFIYKQISV